MLRPNKLMSEFKLDGQNQIKSVTVYYDKKDLLAIDLDNHSPLSHFLDDQKIKELTDKILAEEEKNGTLHNNNIGNTNEKHGPTSTHLDRIYGQSNNLYKQTRYQEHDDHDQRGKKQSSARIESKKGKATEPQNPPSHPSPNQQRTPAPPSQNELLSPSIQIQEEMSTSNNKLDPSPNKEASHPKEPETLIGLGNKDIERQPSGLQNKDPTPRVTNNNEEKKLERIPTQKSERTEERKQEKLPTQKSFQNDERQLVRDPTPKSLKMDEKKIEANPVPQEGE